MGSFLKIVAQDLSFDGQEFIQRNEVFFLRKPAFVSWAPTKDSPKEKDGWYWLAGDTLRIAKEKGVTLQGQKYSVQPVSNEATNNNRSYSIEWSLDGDHILIHLALPQNFTVDINSLAGHAPDYVKLNRGRLCLGWLIGEEDDQDFKLTLIQCSQGDFVQKARSIIRKLETNKARKQWEREALSLITSRSTKYAVAFATLLSLVLTTVFISVVNMLPIKFIANSSNSYSIQATTSALIICLVFSFVLPKWRNYLLGAVGLSLLAVLLQILGGPSKQ